MSLSRLEAIFAFKSPQLRFLKISQDPLKRPKTVNLRTVLSSKGFRSKILASPEDFYGFDSKIDSLLTKYSDFDMASWF